MTAGKRPGSKRLNRNWNELLQEVRVAQTGVQLLTGFLVTLPFTTRFTTLDDVQRHVYLTVLLTAVAATGLLVAPAAFHRVLFRQGAREWLVEAANVIALAGLVAMAAATCGVVWLVFDMVTTRTAASLAAGGTIAFIVLLWGVVPGVARWGRQQDG